MARTHPIDNPQCLAALYRKQTRLDLVLVLRESTDNSLYIGARERKMEEIEEEKKKK